MIPKIASPKNNFLLQFANNLNTWIFLPLIIKKKNLIGKEKKNFFLINLKTYILLPLHHKKEKRKGKE